MNLAKTAGLGKGDLSSFGENGITNLYYMNTEDIIFEQFAAYGGVEWCQFMTFLTLVAVVIYFITSSDSASFVVDMLAANGRPEPPMPMKIFWCFLEGLCAIVLLAAADEEDPKGVLNAVKPLPIILGLPFTFLLCFNCQALLIVCAEETGQRPIERKNFSNYIL